MLEYEFFDRRPFQQFLEFLLQRKFDPQSRIKDGLYEVWLPEDLDTQLLESIESFNNRMLDLNQQLFEQEQAADNDYQADGVVVNLQTSQAVYANVDTALLDRIMSVLSPQGFGGIVDAIVDAVERPDARSLCQKTNPEKDQRKP